MEGILRSFLGTNRLIGCESLLDVFDGENSINSSCSQAILSDFDGITSSLNQRASNKESRRTM